VKRLSTQFGPTVSNLSDHPFSYGIRRRGEGPASTRGEVANRFHQCLRSRPCRLKLSTPVLKTLREGNSVGEYSGPLECGGGGTLRKVPLSSRGLCGGQRFNRFNPSSTSQPQKIRDGGGPIGSTPLPEDPYHTFSHGWEWLVVGWRNPPPYGSNYATKCPQFWARCGVWEFGPEST
jgi:hypothetical protein